jgi:glyoxylase-like metal-dependent hydrolase (beta-lactamase superfamily II)
VPTWTVGAIEITRVDDPGFELVLPSDDATVAALQRSPWLRPHFVSDDWSLVVGSSATVVRTSEALVLVDPFLAFDDPTKLDGRLQALRDAGVDTDDVDVVVNTHVDGLGVNLLPDGSPAFPTARYLVPRAELEAIRAGTHGDAQPAAALLPLWDAGRVEASEDGDEVVASVRLEDAPGHNPGHHVVWIEDGGVSAVVIGHLFLHPAQIASPEVENGDLDPVQLALTRRDLLGRCVEAGTRLVGPLFAAPGAGQVHPDGDTWRLEVDA